MTSFRTLALATALWASDKTWALYNGLIAYLLMGALFAGEWLVRGRVRARAALAEGMSKPVADLDG